MIFEKDQSKKTRSQAWLDLHDDAHSIGMKTTATMVYGFGETGAQRVEHLIKIRDRKIGQEDLLLLFHGVLRIKQSLIVLVL